MGLPSSKSGRSDALLCALVVCAAELLTFPISQWPLGDEFSYARTALDFANTGHFLYNGWSTASLGWLPLYGAAWIKIFGYSIVLLRLSMLPLAFASIYLFHRILARFGAARGTAALGALSLGLTPLFLPLTAFLLTDLPSLLVTLVCVAMCQRAVAAPTARATMLWIIGAGILNIVGGTVRQTAFLGVLVIVPSTAWLLRGRRGVLPAGIATMGVGAVCIAAFLHWCGLQPYFLREQLILAPVHRPELERIRHDLVGALLVLSLVTLPAGVAWIAALPRLGKGPSIRLAVLLCILVVAVLLHGHAFQPWLEPWLEPILHTIGFTDYISLRIGGSLLAVAVVWAAAETLFARRQLLLQPSAPEISAALWLLGPYSIVYALLMIPRGLFVGIQDRYMLGLVFPAIVCALLCYRRWFGPRVPALCIVTLAASAVLGICGTHNIFAQTRAADSLQQELQNAGVPRTSISAGFGNDEWVEVELVGHVNSGFITVPAHAYDLSAREWNVTPECSTGHAYLIPKIRPIYIIQPGLSSCFAPSSFPPVTWTSWFPPFHRQSYINLIPPDKIP
jgi:hypothetical protein